MCEVLVKEGGADINIRNDRRQTPFLLAVSQGHAAAIEKLVELGCDILAKDEDGDNAMHLTIIKKANLVQEVPQHEAPKIYEIYQQLNHHEHRLMYALLCYLAQEGCRIEANYKGARIFDWISEPEMRDLIQSYEKKRIVPAATAITTSSNDCSQSRDGITELYNNIEVLNLTPSADSTSTSMEQDNSGGSSSMANCTNNGISNPPTPARRNRNNNIGNNNNNNNNMTNNNNNNNNNIRNDTATPPPLPSTHASSSATTTAATTLNDDEKKINNDGRRNHTISPPLPHHHAEPTTSSSAMIIGNQSETSSSSSPNRNNSQSPPLPAFKQYTHMSRKQQQQQQQPKPPQILNVKPQAQTPQECLVCNETCLLISFEPCHHQICCEDCGLRMKKCLQCQIHIEKRVAINGKVLSHNKETQRQPSADRLRYLESKILEIEETHSCGICMERRRNVAFLCGHSACSKCAETLKTCHM